MKCHTALGSNLMSSLIHCLKRFLPVPHIIWDVNFPTRDEIHAPCTGSAESNLWPPGKSLQITLNH